MCLYMLYLLYLELSPILAYIYGFLSGQANVDYLWASLCLKFAGCRVIFLEQSHNLGFYEPLGCLFLSNKGEHLYTTVIDTYVTDGWALTLTPYSYLSAWWSARYKKADVYTSLVNSIYRNVIVYPDMTTADKPSLYLSFAWLNKMSIQIILTSNKAAVLDVQTAEANHGINLYCYRSEVIKPTYFNTFEEFAEYVALIWLDAEQHFFIHTEELPDRPST